jgi:hypothetical protein
MRTQYDDEIHYVEFLALLPTLRAQDRNGT